MSIGLHCDGPACDTWAREDRAGQCGFLIVVWDESLLHFCSWDCVLLYGSRIDPMTEVSS